MTLAMTGCETDNKRNNNSGNYEHVHVQMGDKVFHDDVLSWFCYSDSTTCNLKLKTYGEMKTGIQNVLLYNGLKCPLCNK